MVEVILKAPDPSNDLALIRNVIEKEVACLKKGAERALGRLKSFEDKYQVTCSDLGERFTAEELPDQDLEYVEWMRAYRLLPQLVKDLLLLKSLTYVTC